MCPSQQLQLPEMGDHCGLHLTEHTNSLPWVCESLLLFSICPVSTPALRNWRSDIRIAAFMREVCVVLFSTAVSSIDTRIAAFMREVCLFSSFQKVMSKSTTAAPRNMGDHCGFDRAHESLLSCAKFVSSPLFQKMCASV